MTKNVITVDGATEEEKEIVLHLARHAINAGGKNHFRTVYKSKESESRCD